jgi:hypothetical protein
VAFYGVALQVPQALTLQEISKMTKLRWEGNAYLKSLLVLLSLILLGCDNNDSEPLSFDSFCNDSTEINCSNLSEKHIEEIYLQSLLEIKKLTDLRDSTAYINENICCPFIKNLLRIRLAESFKDYDIQEDQSFWNDVKNIDKPYSLIILLSSLADHLEKKGKFVAAQKHADDAYMRAITSTPSSNMSYSTIYMLSKVLMRLSDRDKAYAIAEVLDTESRMDLLKELESIESSL